MTKPRTPRPVPLVATPRLGVVLVDPLPVVLAGLGMLIENRPELEVVAEAGSVKRPSKRWAGSATQTSS